MIGCITNPLFLFAAVWGTATILYLAGVSSGMFPSPHPATVVMLLLNAVTFSLGYLTWTLFRGVEPVEAPSPAGPPLTAERFAFPLKLTLAAGLASLLFEMYRLAVIAAQFDTTWLYLLTHPELSRLRMVAFISQGLYRTSGIVMLLSVMSSLFSIGFVLLGIFLHVDRTGRKYLYLLSFLGISMIIAMIHLTRHEITSNVLYLVFAYCFTCRQNRPADRCPRPGHDVSARNSSHLALRRSHLKLAIPIAAVALLFGVIDVLLDKSSAYGQPGPLRGFLFQVYWYIASSLAALNDFVTTFAGDHQWGRNTFLPLYKWLCRLHLAQEADIPVYAQMVFIPHAANTYTYLRSFYEDFGILGVALVPYLLGWAAAAVRSPAHRHFQFLNLYLVLLLLILFSFYSYYISSNQIYLQVLFGFLLFRYEIPQAQRMSTFRWYQDSST